MSQEGTAPLEEEDVEIVIGSGEEQEPEKEPEPEPVQAVEEEAEEYSARVKKRIDQLTKKHHDERRARERAEADREATLQYTRGLQQEFEAAQKRLSEGEKILKNEAVARTDAEIAAARQALNNAYTTNDPEELAAANERMARAAADAQNVKNFQPRQAPVNIPQPPQPQPAFDPKAEEWRKENTWFGQDRVMTAAAMGYHSYLVSAGVQPSSDEYYERIDTELRSRFPDRFEVEDKPEPAPSQPSPPPANVVAPAERTSGKQRRIVLTPSQQRTIDRLGITREQYAAQLAKESTNE